MARSPHPHLDADLADTREIADEVRQIGADEQDREEMRITREQLAELAPEFPLE